MLLIIARRRLGPSPGCPGPNTLPAQGNAPAFPSHPSTPFPAFGQGATWEKTTKAGSSGTSGCHRDPSRLGKSRTRSSHGHWVALLFLNKIRRRRRIYRAFIGIAAAPSPPQFSQGSELGASILLGLGRSGAVPSLGQAGTAQRTRAATGTVCCNPQKRDADGKNKHMHIPQHLDKPLGKGKDS